MERPIVKATPWQHLRPLSRRPAPAWGVLDAVENAAIQILIWADGRKQDKADRAGLL